MSKSHRRRKDARPGEILDAALAEFALNGFAATRLDDVAKRAGITKGTVYLYFDSKEALFRALLEQESGRNFAEIDGLLDGYTGPADKLLQLLIRQAGVRLIASDLRHLIRLLIAEGPRFPDLLAFHHAEVISRGRRLIERVLRYGIERGEFRDNGLVKFPQIIVAGPMLAMLWQSLFAEFEPLDLEAYLDTLSDTLLHGMMVRK
ncbi:MAG: TetR/AcrR family transcriptional regulator [Gammaproteobacteria bacterium]|nr:TetR/AcrR family transcriptional regulator [Gammaproteobacteria bacterium]